MQRHLISVLALLVTSSGAFAQPLLGVVELCELVSKAKMEARVSGKEIRIATDFDSNTRVAICNRLYEVSSGSPATKLPFFVQMVFFQGGIFARQPREGCQNRVGSEKIDLPGIGEGARFSEPNPVDGRVYLCAYEKDHVLWIIAGHDFGNGGRPKPVDARLLGAVVETAKDYMARWPD
jgi:hypothetical protein